jgi:hypothetical protein
MRIRTVLAAAAVALGLGLTASSPASAFYLNHHHHWGHGFGFGWGGVGFADVGGFDDESCVQWRPMHNRFGEYIGRRPVNVCD